MFFTIQVYVTEHTVCVYIIGPLLKCHSCCIFNFFLSINSSTQSPLTLDLFSTELCIACMVTQRHQALKETLYNGFRKLAIMILVKEAEDSNMLQ